MDQDVPVLETLECMDAAEQRALAAAAGPAYDGHASTGKFMRDAIQDRGGAIAFHDRSHFHHCLAIRFSGNRHPSSPIKVAILVETVRGSSSLGLPRLALSNSLP